MCYRLAHLLKIVPCHTRRLEGTLDRKWKGVDKEMRVLRAIDHLPYSSFSDTLKCSYERLSNNRVWDAGRIISQGDDVMDNYYRKTSVPRLMALSPVESR